MLNAVSAQEGIDTEFGTDIKRLVQSGEKSLLEDEAGKQYGPFDFVVVADGAKSSLRPAYDDGQSLRKQVTPYQWGGYGQHEILINM